MIIFKLKCLKRFILVNAYKVNSTFRFFPKLIKSSFKKSLNCYVTTIFLNYKTYLYNYMIYTI